MRKLYLGMAISAVTIANFTSCKDKTCYYFDQKYNSSTKQCECIQMLDIDNVPVLKHDDYNTVLAVNQNFYYASVDNKDYPYYSHEGDTIMFYGNVDHMEYSYPDSAWVRLHIHDTSESNGVGRSLEAECLVSELEGIDLSDRCYVTGILTFDWATTHVEIPISAAELGRCRSRGFFFKIEDIHN